MDLSRLRTYVKVVQAGSFTGAAEALDTSRSHVSRVIAQLEAELGVKLLERTTRAQSLTEFGRELYERAVGIVDAVESTALLAQRARGEPDGVLRLTCGAEFGMLAVNRWIAEFLARHPKASVEAEYTSRVIDLVHEGFDLAVRIGPIAESRLVARRIGEVDYGLFAAPDYLRQRRAPREPAQLGEHALILFAPGGQRRALQLRTAAGGQAVDVRAAPRLRVNNGFAVRDAVVGALGIGVLPLLIAAEPGTREKLVRVLPDWAIDPAPVHAVYPSNRYLAPKVRAFIDLAAERLPAQAAEARGAGFATAAGRAVRAKIGA